MPRARRVHRILGLVLLLPVVGWAITGFVFFVKPGYDAAYESLRVRQYLLEGGPIPSPGPGWLEARSLRTMLGDHLLIRTETGWTHLDPATLQPMLLPDDASIRRLVEDAIGTNRARYGEIAVMARNEESTPSASIRTTTGVEIDLDWSTLEFRQIGKDTRRIDALYRVHYLQWTGIGALDRVLGVVGLASLIVLAALGLRLALRFGPPRGQVQRSTEPTCATFPSSSPSCARAIAQSSSRPTRSPV